MSAVREMHYISKSYTMENFPHGVTTIEDKLKLFADRVSGWQLEIAAQLIADNPHAGFGVLHIVTSYFEMIGMYLKGPAIGKRKKRKRKGRSRVCFVAGARDVFPELAKEKPKHEAWFLNSMYGDVRCGLYHQGMTKGGIFVSQDIGAPFEFRDLGKGKHAIVLNPKLLTDRLTSHFDDYVRKIEDPANAEARANFEGMFDQKGA